MDDAKKLEQVIQIISEHDKDKNYLIFIKETLEIINKNTNGGVNFNALIDCLTNLDINNDFRKQVSVIFKYFSEMDYATLNQPKNIQSLVTYHILSSINIIIGSLDIEDIIKSNTPDFLHSICKPLIEDVANFKNKIYFHCYNKELHKAFAKIIKNLEANLLNITEDRYPQALIIEKISRYLINLFTLNSLLDHKFKNNLEEFDLELLLDEINTNNLLKSLSNQNNSNKDIFKNGKLPVKINLNVGIENQPYIGYLINIDRVFNSFEERLSTEVIIDNIHTDSFYIGELKISFIKYIFHNNNIEFNLVMQPTYQFLSELIQQKKDLNCNDYTMQAIDTLSNILNRILKDFLHSETEVSFIGISDSQIRKRLDEKFDKTDHNLRIVVDMELDYLINSLRSGPIF